VKLRIANPTRVRHIDFTYINRIIVWNAIGNSLSFLLPFIDVNQIKSLFQTSESITSFVTMGTEMDSFGVCGICGTAHICMPCEALPCKHRYCYYCIEVARKEAGGQKCRVCGIEIQSAELVGDLKTTD